MAILCRAAKNSLRGTHALYHFFVHYSVVLNPAVLGPPQCSAYTTASQTFSLGIIISKIVGKSALGA
jgi:hypothetical protein